MKNEILKFWHQVEFFQAFPLEERLETHKVYTLYPKQVMDQNLPWMDPYALELAGGTPGQLYRYILYLGLFDKSELTRVGKGLLKEPLDPLAKVEWEERLDQEGLTCFAKLTLDKHGTPEWDNLSLSTLPWALGKMDAGKGETISFVNYEVDCSTLMEYISRIPYFRKDNHEMINAEGLMHLCQGLFNWANFSPLHQPLLAIELQKIKGETNQKLLTDQVKPLPIKLKDLKEKKEKKKEFGILNSFYIKDLERVLREGYKGTPLELYLEGEVGVKGVLEKKILPGIHPEFALKGRWPSPKNQLLNLMQQFSVQTAFDYLNKGGLYSVNGPPGTGKTTLIREIVAENMVRRAIALSKFSTPQAAFTYTESVSFGNQKQAQVSHLHPSLTGFEMVIASSNNAAVENISKELPRESCIASSAWYLKSVANKIVATHDKQGKVEPVPPNQKCWGLIAAALGKRSNCQNFLEKGFILKGNDTYQTIWEWSKSYKGKSFHQAKKEFLKLLAEVNNWQEGLCEGHLLDKVSVPPANIDLKDPTIHHSTFWQCEELNSLKSNLFMAAMTLHEAWLADVTKPRGGFGGNLVAISHILSRASPTIDRTYLPIWQSLFMLVPVVSSTFASFSRLFNSLGAGKIGWLIIDEAGQAIPQAAVGALWRSKRALVLGDPQQIEPIMSIPPPLVDNIGYHLLGDEFANWTPTLTSVQKIADSCNPFGIEMEGQWVGSPLRVHRRCIDPMFTIANKIAYDDGMVQSPLQKNEHLPDSCWYHISGEVSHKQYVSSQGEFVLKQISDYVEKHMELPKFYIISPFRIIKRKIQTLIVNHPFPAKIPKKEINRWATNRVGTVHSFQGKEEEAVFFILGADFSTQPSVSWAAQKPNLLNVAVTRAKQRLYIVGDVHLWSKKALFKIAAEELPIIEV